MSFIKIARNTVSHDFKAKSQFHRLGKAMLEKLAKALGLAKGEYDIRSNMGGDAVSGEVTLHSDTLYVQFSQSCVLPERFMWRTCKGRKDYTGGRNQWMLWTDLEDLETVAKMMNRQVPVEKAFAEGALFVVC